MRVPIYAATLLLAATFSFAADPPPAPNEIKIEAGKPISVEVGKKCILTIETTAKKVTWRFPAGIDAVPLDGKRLAVWATPGIYTLVAQVPAGDDVLSTDVVLTITGGVGPPPPVDQLIKDLRTAYANETGSNDATNLANLADLLGQVVAAAKTSGKVTQTGQLQTLVKQSTDLAIGANALPATRKAIGAYLTPRLGTASVPVTEAFWLTASTEYAAVSAALKKVGGK